MSAKCTLISSGLSINHLYKIENNFFLLFFPCFFSCLLCIFKISTYSSQMKDSGSELKAFSHLMGGQDQCRKIVFLTFLTIDEGS